MKNYLEYIIRESFFIRSVIKSYDCLIKSKEIKKNYNELINKEQKNIKNLKINEKEIFDNFNVNLNAIKDFKGYIVSHKKEKNNYVINKTNDNYENDIFSVSGLTFNLKNNKTNISNVYLKKILNKGKLIIYVDVEESSVNFHVNAEDKNYNFFGVARLVIYDNKIDKLEMNEGLKSDIFKECMSLFNKINKSGYIEEIIDFLILNKDFTEEELNLYLIAYDLDFKKELENPLRINFKEKNDILMINKKCYNSLK